MDEENNQQQIEATPAEQDFDGVQFSPQFAVALKDFILKLIPSSGALVSSVTASGSGITASPTTGAVVISNTGVVSLIAGSNISLSGSTGTVTVSASSGTHGTWTSGTGSRAFNSASSTDNIPHGLGTTPKFLRVTAFWGLTTSNMNWAQSTGTYDGTNQHEIFQTFIQANSPGGLTSADGSHIVTIIDPGAINAQTADATWDATNINLAWTKVNSPSGQSIFYIWEAFA